MHFRDADLDPRRVLWKPRDGHGESRSLRQAVIDLGGAGEAAA
ncbi:MAG: hypothetical protein U0835_20510 [Isosphaeraceae bacterium]